MILIMLQELLEKMSSYICSMADKSKKIRKKEDYCNNEEIQTMDRELSGYYEKVLSCRRSCPNWKDSLDVR